jgi:uncharacterized protein
LLVFVVALAMAVGLICTVVPMVPGLVIIWLAGLGYGIVDGFGTVGGWAFGGMTVLLVLGSIATYVLPHRAGVRAGVPSGSLRLGIAGGIVGFFVIPVLGLPIGAVAGVLIGEQQRLGSWSEAWLTTRRVVLGFGVGALAEIAAGLLMISCWVAWVLLGG